MIFFKRLLVAGLIYLKSAALITMLLPLLQFTDWVNRVSFNH
jgi:hypothetical protein